MRRLTQGRVAYLRNRHGQKLCRIRLGVKGNRSEVLTPPLVQHIGVDAMLQREPRYRHADFARCRCQLPLELGVVIEPPFLLPSLTLESKMVPATIWWTPL